VVVFILKVYGLTKRYTGIPVVQDVSFTIRRGEILGYLGPNGAGNSNSKGIDRAHRRTSVSRSEGLTEWRGQLRQLTPMRTRQNVIRRGSGSRRRAA
jgi:ABC-2 type transport system ATP-binding protein